MKLARDGSLEFGKEFKDDVLFFHTSLDKKKTEDNVFLIVECVIIAEREERGTPEVKHFSGGYAKMKLFPAPKDTGYLDLL